MELHLYCTYPLTCPRIFLFRTAPEVLSFKLRRTDDHYLSMWVWFQFAIYSFTKPNHSHKHVIYVLTRSYSNLASFILVDYVAQSFLLQLESLTHCHTLTHWPLWDLWFYNNESVFLYWLLFSDFLYNLVVVNDNALSWMPWDFTNDRWTLVQVMVWCCQATSHYLNQCWPNSRMP